MVHRGGSALRAAALALLVAGAAACASFGGVRPRYAPLATSVRIVTNRDAAALIVSLDSAVRAAGFTVQRSAPREGYLETAWYDVERRTTVPPPFTRLDRVVKLRFFADPEQGRTRLLAECVVRVAWDPSVPERELERMAPAESPGCRMMEDVLRNAGAAGATVP